MERFETPPRLAAIDVGTNSLRLIVAEVESPATYRILDDERAQTRLGEGLYESGRISDEAFERSLAVLGTMKAIADGNPTNWVMRSARIRSLESNPMDIP
jgi:exopolyphosphatase/guanosine-5'-triphosphate,3'-diphosphate pyrophosphatase